MKFFLFLLLLSGIFLSNACQVAELDDGPPVPTSTTTASPTLTEPLTKVAVPTSTATSAATSPAPDEATATPTSITATPDTSLSLHGDSFSPVISADGRYVAFVSQAGDLVESESHQCLGPGGAAYNCSDVFLFDRESGRMQLISFAPDGQPANGNSYSPAISDDGQWLAFVSEATNLAEEPIGSQGLFLYDMQNGRLQLIAPASGSPSISADGRFVAYGAGLSPPTVYLYDQETGNSELISQGRDEQRADGDSIAPQISADGRWVAFWSWAGNLLSEDTETCRENEAMNYSCGDVYLFERETGQIERIPVGEGYGLGMGIFSLSLSTDGSRLAFNCQVYEREITYQLIYGERCGQLSRDGQFIAFQQGADFFVQELATSSVIQVSLASNGTPSNGELINYETTFAGARFNPGFDVSENAQWVVFASTANNLTPNDTHICDNPFFTSHNCYDIYIHERETGLTEWISKPDDVN